MEPYSARWIAHRRINRFQLRVAIRLPCFFFRTVAVDAEPLQHRRKPSFRLLQFLTGALIRSVCVFAACEQDGAFATACVAGEGVCAASDADARNRAGQRLQSAEPDSYKSPCFDRFRLEATNQSDSGPISTISYFRICAQIYCVSGSSMSDSCRTTITMPDSVTWKRRLSASTS